MEAVIFDLGNVLLSFNWDVAVERFCARANCERRKLDDYIVTTPFTNQLAEGKLSKQRFFEIITKDFKFPGSYEEFALIWSDIFTVDEVMVALAAALRGHYRRYVLSNTNAVHMDFIFARYPFIHTFEGLVLSHEVGLQKPDHRIYEWTLARYGLTASRTVFIDDIWANVEGARGVGMQAIHHRDAASTREGLTKLGVTGI